MSDLERFLEAATLNSRYARYGEALRAIRDFRQEENEWDGVDEVIPAMRKLAADALEHPSQPPAKPE